MAARRGTPALPHYPEILAASFRGECSSQHFLHFFEQFSRLKWLGENLKSLQDLPIFEAAIVEKPTHDENRNSGAHVRRYIAASCPEMLSV